MKCKITTVSPRGSSLPEVMDNLRIRGTSPVLGVQVEWGRGEGEGETMEGGSVL
jgi:hypothetical protein